jgi:hypothetical protein
MRVQIFECIEKNSGQLTPVDGRFVYIKKGRYIDNNTSHPLYAEKEKYFARIYCLGYLKKRIYFLNRFGNKDSNTGFHVGFTWLQHQHFLLLQNRHWVQKEENIRYVINVLFLFIGAYIGFKNLK